MSWKNNFRQRPTRNRVRYRNFSSRRKAKTTFLHRLAILSFVGVIGLFLLSFVVFPIVAVGLPSPDEIVRRDGFSTKIYDRNDVLLYDINAGEQRRTLATLEQIPEYLKQATIAIEDKNFYKHQGFDPFGVLRGFSRLFTQGRAQGGSTLTQQLVKNVLLSPERTIFRKVKEFILSVQIEREYSKDQILQMYLNEAPYGGTAWGVQAASEIYFDKKVNELKLVEAAILAGLPQRPTGYSPYGTNPTAYVERTEQVLRRMREDGYITKDQEAEAANQLADVKFAGKSALFKAPHFVAYVQSILEERYGSLVEQGGLKITTSLDWELQNEAQRAVSEEISKVESLNITNGAAVVVDAHTGEILTMVGSKDFTAEGFGQYNTAIALRQPGSAIKPVTYATALKKGYTAATLLMDTPTVFPGGVGNPDYKPVNYDGEFRGPVQMRYALANSINIPAVKMLAMVGVKDMLDTAYGMGLTTLEPTKENLSRFGLAVTLGGGEVRLLELTSAYATFANGGKRFDPVAILKVEDANGKVLEEFRPSNGRDVLSPEVAFIISDILSDNQARSEIFGTNSALRINGVAAKTGTTNDLKDNWTIGWSSDVAVGVWVGNNDNSEMRQVASGVSGAAPIWRRVMLEVLKTTPTKGFTPPSNIVEAQVDTISGYSPQAGFPTRTEYFIKGTQPQEDIVHVKLRVCREDGRLATPSQVASGNYEEKEFFVFKEEDPFGPPNRWQEGILTWASTQTDSRYNPPTEYCGESNPVFVDFINPKDKEKINSNNFEVRVDPKSTTDITEVTIEIAGKKYLITNSPWRVKVKDIPDGVHKLKATAKDKNGKTGDREITIGVNTDPAP